MGCSNSWPFFLRCVPLVCGLPILATASSSWPLSTRAVLEKATPMPWAKRFGGPGISRPSMGSAGVTTLVTSRPSGLAFGPVKHAGHEAVGDHTGEPAPVEGDGGGHHHDDPPRRRGGRTARSRDRGTRRPGRSGQGPGDRRQGGTWRSIPTFSHDSTLSPDRSNGDPRPGIIQPGRGRAR